MKQSITVVLGSIFISLLAIPTMYLLSTSQTVEESVNVFLYGTIVCFVALPILYYLLILRNLKNYKGSFYLFLFTIFSFSCVVDFILALTSDGFINFGLFYLSNGETYLNTSHGAFINYWDAIVHYILYIYLIYCMVEGINYRYVGLFWFGSIWNSLIVLLIGSTVGQHSTNLQWSYLLNVPYVFVPMIFLKQTLSMRDNHKEIVRNSFSSQVINFIFALLYIPLILFSIFRTMAVLDSKWIYLKWWVKHVEPYLMDPNAFPKLQIITYFFYLIPYLTVSIFHWNNNSWLIDFSAIVAGGVCQGQFSYIGGANHILPIAPERTWVPVPEEGMLLFWIFNIGLILLPLLQFLWIKKTRKLSE